MSSETIIAQSSTTSRADSIVIRLSGPDAISCIQSCFVAHNNQALSGTFHFYDGMLSFGAYPAIPARVLIMRAPSSYTREDVVECILPGAQILAREFIRFCTEQGIRFAYPGEFTRRAFENGRINVLQAGAIMKMIRAQDNNSLAVAGSMLFGGAEQTLEQIRKHVQDLLALVEIQIDFSDQNLDVLSETEYMQRVHDIIELLEQILQTRAVSSLEQSTRHHIVIAGMVNAGKSTLFNMLLKQNRATVSSVAGTTRDIIKGRIHVSEYDITLYDTAGLSDAPDLFEHHARSMMEDGYFNGMWMMLAIAPDNPLSDSVMELLLRTPGPRRTIVVATKSDMGMNSHLEHTHLKECCAQVSVSESDHSSYQRLTDTIVSLFSTETEPHDIGQVLYRAVAHARESMRNLQDSSKRIDYPEIRAEFLRETLDNINIFYTGDQGPELLNSIFADFCIGK